MSNLIAIDWGTSSFRMYLMGSKGEILQTISTGDGILSISNQTFELTLSRHLEKLKDVAPDTPIIASGMITSKKGWCETPYAMCPADVGSLAEKMVPQESDHHGTIWFVPGIKQHLLHA